MDIRNFTQFACLLQATQTVNRHPAFDKLVNCMMVYNSICSCGGQSDKDKSTKSAECNRIYREALGNVDGIKAYFFQNTTDSTITFYVDGIYAVKTICR
jgi:hypothetical protein